MFYDFLLSNKTPSRRISEDVLSNHSFSGDKKLSHSFSGDKKRLSNDDDDAMSVGDVEDNHSPAKSRHTSGKSELGGARIRRRSYTDGDSAREDRSSGGEDNLHVSSSSSASDRKMTREEKKIAAYMKAFEALEKKQTQKTKIVVHRRKHEDKKHIKSEDDGENTSGDESYRPAEKVLRRKRKSSCRNSQTRKSRRHTTSCSVPESTPMEEQISMPTPM